MARILGLLSVFVCNLPLLSQTSVDYARDVHPILAARCLSCHTQEKRSGGLSLATYDDVLNGGRTGAVVRPGQSAASLILQRISGSVPPRMPLAGDPLTTREIATIAAWIDQGARANPNSAAARPRWESPLALTAPAVPDSPWKNWTDPIDRFTATYLEAHHTAEPALVSDAEFARRAYLDIWGLLPTPEQLRSFLDDREPGKRRQLVTTLLADSTKYSENWISYWNDVLRNEEGVAYYSEAAGRKSITGWLNDALRTNLPYNQWIAQLLNPSAASDPDGFLIGVNWRGAVSASQTPALQAAQNSAQIFLGINLKCNSCHDSFISRWKLKDAYALAGYFSTEEKLRLYRCDLAQDQSVSASFLYPELNRPLPSTSVADRRAAAVAIFTDPRNGRMPRTLVNRIWQKLLGRGLVENVDEMDGEPWSPELLDWLAGDFASSGYDLKHLIATIASSRAYQLPAVAHKGETPRTFVFRGPELRRLTAEQFADAVASITGDWRVASFPPNGRGGGRGGVPVVLGSPIDGAVADRPRPAATPAPNRANATPPPPIPPGSYAREWRIAGNSLTRALGRPIRDQVFSTRDTQATTIQALELVNGETLTHWLWRGARRMLGELPAEPKSLFSRQVNADRGAQPTFDLDISRSQKLYFIVQDAQSTAPDKTAPFWQISLRGPQGAVPLSALRPVDTAGLRDESNPLIPVGGTQPVADGLRVKLSSVVVYDIAGKGFTRLEGAPGLESVPLIQGESAQARFFVFDQPPSLDRLVPPNPETPLPAGPVLQTIPQAVDRVYWYALGRAPSAAERQIAEAALRDPARPGHPSAEGMADLLWAILMTPEFQLIR